MEVLLDATRRRAGRLTAILAAGAVLTLAACGGAEADGASPAPIVPTFPPCSEVYAEGATAHLDAAGNWDPSCTEAGGMVNVGITASKHCPDGSKVAWTDSGWTHNGIVHAGQLDVDGDGEFKVADVDAACTR